MRQKGFVQVYTGNGKGKTTAALGLALRACGAGKKVFIGQFVKGKHYSEIEAIRKHLKNIELKQYGLGCFIVHKPKQEDIDAVRKGLEEMKSIIMSGRYDIVIMDELNIAIHYKLFTVEEVIDLIKNKPGHVEIIITGRYAHEKVLEIADLITEMKEIKHYFTKGIQARKGIEM